MHGTCSCLQAAAAGGPEHMLARWQVLEHNRVKCGYAKTGNVQKGDLGDLQVGG